LLAYLLVGELALLFEQFALVVSLVAHGFVVRTGMEGRFHPIDPARHAHILIQYFEGLHDPHLAILELLVGNGVGNVSQFLYRLLALLELFVSGEGGLLSGGRTRRTGGLLYLFKRVFGVLDLHEVEEVLGVGLPL